MHFQNAFQNAIKKIQSNNLIKMYFSIKMHFKFKFYFILFQGLKIVKHYLVKKELKKRKRKIKNKNQEAGPNILYNF